MAKDFLPFITKVTNIRDKLEKLSTRVEELKALENSSPKRDMQNDIFSSKAIFPWRLSPSFQRSGLELRINLCTLEMTIYCSLNLTSLVSEEEQSLRIDGRRIADAVVVSAVVLLSIIYHYVVGYIDRGGSKAGSSSSLDFRDIYISIVLFQAAYVWIKFRDVIPSIPRGALYYRPRSNTWEPRIKFPRGVGGNSKRIPLGSFDTEVEAEAAYRVAAFYCHKPKHCLGRLDLGGGAYFRIPALSVDPNLPYEEKVKQVGDQVLRVYAEFEEQKASRNLPQPRVSGLALEMSTGEGQLLTTSPIQQLRQPLNSGLDSAMQGQGSQFGLSIHNGVDFNNPGDLLPVLLKTQHELLGAYKQQECLKAEVSRTEVESMGWEVNYSELNRKYSELEHENGLLNHQIMLLQSQLQIQHEEQEFDPDRLFSMGHEESLAR